MVKDSTGIERCEDYKRSVFDAVTGCYFTAKYVYTDNYGERRLLCGIHAKMYPKDMVKPLREKECKPN